MLRKISVLLFFVLVSACSNPAEIPLIEDLQTTDGQHQADGLEQPDNTGDLSDLSIDTGDDEDLGLDFIVPDKGDDTKLDADTGGPQCQPGDGCFLDPCTENSNCLSGWCIEHLGEDVCTQTCVEECPDGFECKKLSGAEPDVVFACVSKWPRLCLPCTDGQDCKTAEQLGGQCVQPGESVEFFCGSNCAAPDDCPEGYICSETVTVDGKIATQCVPSGGECPCTQKAIVDALYTVCSLTNEWGSCQGYRVCEETGLAPCDAVEPTEEICDGLDNNCDGVADEGSCEDDNPCTEDACLGEDGCSFTPIVGLECTDGDLCTTGDHCEEGVCIGNPVVCDDGNPCTDDFCDELGACAADNNHALCNDSNPCTLGDVCDEGACIGTPIACDCQKDEDCDAFEDNNVCNGTLYCDKTGLPYQCKVAAESVVNCVLPDEAQPFCQKAECVPATGECLVLANNEGFGCNDDNACTIGEKCIDGACAGGTDYPCSDGKQCTSDGCNPETGCVFIDVGGACDDSDPCTIGDVCTDGACQSGQAVDCDDQNLCTADSCNSQAGCTHLPADGQCDDSNPCTTGDACLNGFCMPGGMTNCADLNPCTTDSCSPDVGCVHTLNSEPCDDSNPCTIGDTCSNGACQGTGTKECTDNNPCTDDVCDPLQGCVFSPNNDECNDNNLCTTNEICTNGACTPQGLLNCDDQNPCTIDSCDSLEGCKHESTPGECDDDNQCTKDDVCTMGVCQGDFYDCDDEIVCTNDVCDGSGGCFHSVVNGWCFIEDKCYETGVLKAGNICQSCQAGKNANVWSDLDGGVCAQVDNGTATCAAGECALTGCDEGFDDCDEVLETGCEIHILTNIDNCGQCNNPCDAPETCTNGGCGFVCPGGLIPCDQECVDPDTDPLHCGDCDTTCKASSPELLGICTPDGCDEEPCPDNTFNPDLMSDNGCEYECALTGGGVEICDYFDNDCDGDVDEGFELDIDPVNCGECGEICGPYQHVDVVGCEDGECTIEDCEDGYEDLDKVVLNGCEEMTATGELWVNWENFMDLNPDGSKAHPFLKIADALAVAEDGMVIHVVAGGYLGGHNVAIPNLTIQGEASEPPPGQPAADPVEEVFVNGPNSGTVFTIAADNVTIKDLQVVGGMNGIHFNSVTGGKVENVWVHSISAPANQEGIGIYLSGCTGVIITDVDISSVKGGTGSSSCSPATGQEAAGIMVHATQSTQILDTTIWDITGGSGGKATCSYKKGGAGNVAAAVLVRSNSNAVMIQRSDFHSIYGGKGGAYSYSGSSGNGGLGAAVYQSTGNPMAVQSTVIYNVRGGLTSANQPSAYSACIYGSNVGTILVSNLTCAGSGIQRQRGIWADPSAQGLFGISNSIFAGLSDKCLYNHSSNFQSTVLSTWNDFFECGTGIAQNSQTDQNSLEVDPLFVEPDTKNYKLKLESPCIDAGKPSSDYCTEAAPNGCRVNMGAYGNTSSSTSKEGAEDCDC